MILEEMPQIRITDEMIAPRGPDLISQLQARQEDAYICLQRAELAAVCGDYTAWMMYPPTPHDDPADYEPYWSRLTDVVEDQDEREAIVASWLSRNRPLESG